MNILHIDSSLQGSFSVSRQLSRAIVDQLREQHHASKVVEVDLSQSPVPHLSSEHVSAFFSSPDGRSEAHQELVAKSDALVDQLFWADSIVIGVAMINFAIPSTLKAWLDQVTRAGKTFSYGENGPEGLVKGKKVYLAISTGGVYSEGAAKAFDFTEPYLRTVLGFLGMHDIHTVRAEGVRLAGNREKAIDAALGAIPVAVGA